MTSWMDACGQSPGMDVGPSAGAPASGMLGPCSCLRCSLSAYDPPAWHRGLKVPVDLTWVLGPRKGASPVCPWVSTLQGEQSPRAGNSADGSCVVCVSANGSA